MADMADASSRKKVQTASSSRLSIYDGPGAPILLVPEPPSALQLQISSVRKAAQSVYGDLSNRARLASNQWIGAEHKLEHEISTIRARDEPLTPGAFYVGITTLLGSILTRNRLFPLRILTPPTFLLASTAYFLPKHFGNLISYTAAFQQMHTPELYEVQLQLASRLQDLQARAASLVMQGSRGTQEVTARVSPWIEERTGLSLTSKRPVQPRSETKA